MAKSHASPKTARRRAQWRKSSHRSYHRKRREEAEQQMMMYQSNMTYYQNCHWSTNNNNQYSLPSEYSFGAMAPIEPPYQYPPPHQYEYPAPQQYQYPAPVLPLYNNDIIPEVTPSYNSALDESISELFSDLCIQADEEIDVPDYNSCNIDVSIIDVVEPHDSDMIRLGMNSFIIKGWAQKRRAVMSALDAMLVPQYTAPFNTTIGQYVSVDAPFGENANTPTPSCISRKVFRNYYGRVIFDDWLYCYGTATGAYTVGIPPNQFVNRPFTNEMDVISQHIQQTATQIYEGNNDVIITLPNHMTQLSFYPKRPEVKEDLQLAFHNDCLWDHNGSWIPHKNTQAKMSPTYSLTIGDARILTMKEWKAGVGKEGTLSSLPEKKILLEHGDLFVLDPRDDKYLLRGGKKFKTCFKHGGITVASGKDKLSIGLIFRTVTAKNKFDLKTGLVKLDNNFWTNLTEERKSEYAYRDEILKQFTSSGELNACHLQLKCLFEQMRARHF